MVDKVTENSHGDCEIPKVWTFKDDDVANNFQYHVTHQLPWYNTVTEVVQSLIMSYVREGEQVYDIGCSKGNITKPLVPAFKDLSVNCTGLDTSHQMVKQYQGAGEAVNMDALDYLDEKGKGRYFQVAVCFLSLMFMKHSERRKLLKWLKSRCKDGGAIIIVDKEVSKEGYLGSALTRARLQLKANQGVPYQEIMAKELSLAGVQRPIDPHRELGGGWTEFFRMGEFVGWIYEG